MRAALVVCVCCAAIAIACGGSQKKTVGGVASGSGSASASGSAVASGSSAPVDDSAPLTHDECAGMIGHILDIAAAEKTGSAAPQGDEQAKARKNLIDEQTEACMQQTPHAQYTCAMAAKTSADLQRCAQ